MYNLNEIIQIQLRGMLEKHPGFTKHGQTMENIMSTMPHVRVWRKRMEEIFGEQRTDRIISRAISNYEEYCSLYATETNRSNRNALRTRILPGLSLYQALSAEGLEQQDVLGYMDMLFRAAFFTGRMRGIHILNTFPNPFALIKPVLKLMTRDEYLPGSQKVVEDSADCFAVIVYRCFILDTLVAHGAGELTPLFCNTDDWLAAELPSVNWERNQTLGRGGDCCDFRWSRKRSAEKNK